MAELIRLRAKHRITDGRHIEGRKDVAGAGTRRKTAKGGNAGKPRRTWAYDPANKRLYDEARRVSQEGQNTPTLLLRDGRARFVRHG